MMVATIRVVVAEDHALVRAGLLRLLGDMAGIEVVGVADDGREAHRLVAETEPDVAILDIAMPGMNGMQALARIVEEHPATRVIILSMHDNEEYVTSALRAGATGYLLKDSDPAELELAIRSAIRGGSFISPAVSRHLIRDLGGRDDRGRTGGDRLTARQTEVVQLIAAGQRNSEIAATLGVSTKTVETHRAEIMQRLGIHDIPALVRYAVRMGLISPDD